MKKETLNLLEALQVVSILLEYVFVAAVKIARLNPKIIPTFSTLKKLIYNKVSIVGMYLSQEPLQVFIFKCRPLFAF